MHKQSLRSLCQETPQATRALADLQASRRSCRAFRKEPVESETLELAFSLAQLTPSWCNAQPWEAIVTRGEGTERFREALYEAAKRDMLGANNPEVRSSENRRSDLAMPMRYSGVRQKRRKEAGARLFRAVGVMGDRKASAEYTLENFRLFGAPHAAIFTSATELGAYGILDVGGYINQLMLVLESLGIASIAQAALAVYGDLVHEFFDIPPDRNVVCGMSLGYAESSSPANNFCTDRAPINEIISWHD